MGLKKTSLVKVALLAVCLATAGIVMPQGITFAQGYTCPAVFEWTVTVNARVRVTGGHPAWGNQSRTFEIATGTNNPREAEARAIELFRGDFYIHDIENIRANARLLRR